MKECLGPTFKEIEEIKSEGFKFDGEHFNDEWCVAIQVFLSRSTLFCSSLIYEMNVINDAECACHFKCLVAFFLGIQSADRENNMKESGQHWMANNYKLY